MGHDVMGRDRMPEGWTDRREGSNSYVDKWNSALLKLMSYLKDNEIKDI